MIWRSSRSNRIFIFVLITLVILYVAYNNQTVAIGEQSSSLWQCRVREMKAMGLAEFNYKKKLKTLNSSELNALNKYYHRDVSIHWGSDHGMLPQGKPLPHASCLRHLERDFSTTVTIVMCMRNELIYLLLRTLTTIAKRTPDHLLQEILLIDDASEVDSSPEIRNYTSQLNIPLRMLRNNVTMGITTCRRHGIQQSRGEVVVILDSHMEVSDLWLEPLLDILQSKPGAIAVPTLGLIDEKDYDALHLHVTSPYGIQMVAGYSYFRYYYAKPPENDTSAPYSTASVLGGGLAAYRSTFLDLYPQVVFHELWGTENSRLALRAWICGEGLWMSSCSQILHTNGDDGDLQRYKENSPNMFLHLQYESVGEALNFIKSEKDKNRFLFSIYSDDKHIDNVRNVSKTIAQQFKDSQKCSKDYFWYLKTVHPGFTFMYFLSTEKYTVMGEAQSLFDSQYCICLSNNKVSVEKSCRLNKTAFYDTHMMGFTGVGEVHVTVYTLLCWDTFGQQGNGAFLFLYGCHTNPDLEGLSKPGRSQNFVYNEDSKQIRHVPSGRCAQLDLNQKSVVLWKCNEDLEQKWVIRPPRWI